MAEPEPPKDASISSDPAPNTMEPGEISLEETASHDAATVDGDLAHVAETGEPSAKKVKLDVLVPEDYQEDDEEFPAGWKEMAVEEEEDEDADFDISLEEVKPRIDIRKALLNKKNIDFNDVPEINGVPVTEFDINALEDKPWKKPGADLSDYFNYGFNEDTWKLYTDKQRRMRQDSQSLEATARSISAGARNDNSKYGPSATSHGSGQGESATGAPPFRAQFRRRNPDGTASTIPALIDRKPENSSGGSGMMPPMMMPVGPGVPFGMPNPGMLGGPGMLPPPMMMRPMGDQQRNFQQNQNFGQNPAFNPNPFGGGARRQLTTINLTHAAPSTDNKDA